MFQMGKQSQSRQIQHQKKNFFQRKGKIKVPGFLGRAWPFQQQVFHSQVLSLEDQWQEGSHVFDTPRIATKILSQPPSAEKHISQWSMGRGHKKPYILIIPPLKMKESGESELSTKSKYPLTGTEVKWKQHSFVGYEIRNVFKNFKCVFENFISTLK